MSHWGKHKVVILVRLHILDICFSKNEYFLKNSRYTIFQKNKRKNRIKSLRNIKDSKDLIRIPIEETMLIRATLYQEKSQKDSNVFQEKSRKIVIRQLSKLRSGDAVYRDIGFIEIQLHEVITSDKMKDYEMRLIDPDRKAEAAIRVNIEWDYYDTLVTKGEVALPSVGCFGLCKPDVTEVRSDPKINAEFFQRLRLRFNTGQSEDEDLAMIPPNASIYGDLDQSYSNLLSPTNPNKMPATFSNESLLAGVDGVKRVNSDVVEEGDEEEEKVDEEGNHLNIMTNTPSMMQKHSSNASIGTDSVLSNGQRRSKGYAPSLKWTQESGSAKNNDNITNNASQSFYERALPTPPSNNKTPSPRTANQTHGNMSQPSTSTMQLLHAVTDTEEDVDGEAAAREKARKSRVIAKKLNALSKSTSYTEPSHNFSQTIAAKSEAKVLFLGSDDESVEGRETDECDDLTNSTSPSGIGEISRHQHEVELMRQRSAMTKTTTPASSVDMSLPVYPPTILKTSPNHRSNQNNQMNDDNDSQYSRMSKGSGSLYHRAMMNNQPQFSAEDPNLSFRISTSSNTRVSEANNSHNNHKNHNNHNNRPSLRHHRSHQDDSSMHGEDFTIISDLSSVRQSQNFNHSNRNSSQSLNVAHNYLNSINHQQNPRQSTNLHYSAVYQRGREEGADIISPPYLNSGNSNYNLMRGNPSNSSMNINNNIGTRQGNFRNLSSYKSEEVANMDYGNSVDFEEEVRAFRTANQQ